MLDASWLGKIAAGRFETEIVPLTITNGYGESFEGQGSLTWTSEHGVQIGAMTNGSETLLKRLGQSPCSVGQVIPAEYYLQLHGRTRNGEQVVIERICPGDYSLNVGHPTVVWKIPQNSVYSNVSFAEPKASLSKDAYAEAILSPMLLSWPRRSETTYDNPHFGIQSSDSDWLAFTYSGGQVSAQRLANDLGRVRVEQAGNVSPDVSLAVSLAFGFLTGRKVSIVGKEVRNERSLTRTIFYPTTGRTRNRFSPPLSDNPGLLASCEPMLSKATEFFCTEMGKQAGNLLHMCHMSVDSTFTIHSLVACVVLESLVKLLAPSKGLATTITAEQKDKILTNLREIGLGEQVAERFSGFIRKMDEVSPKNHLHTWAAGGLLGIIREDAKAWDRLRNRAAHGRLLMDGKDKAEEQKHWTALQRVKNLINKLLLNAMQYDGNYYDHVDHHVRAFAHAELTDL